MTLIVAELRTALVRANVPDDLAEAAARAVVPVERLQELVTKGDLENTRLALKADLAELKVDLLRWTVGLLLAQTAVIAALVRLL